MESAPLPPVVCLMGPTAAGKTGLALSLAEQYPMDIISVDSALVYREMDVGTAKPDAQTLRRAPHRLIDIRDPSESYSAAEFRADALREMRAISKAGRIPLLVGGTMLYFRALLEGLAELPAADAALRARLEQRANDEGWAQLHAELAQSDPEAAGRINPNDSQRIQRALEVLELTGRPLSELQREQQDQTLPYRVLKIVVCPPDRALLHQRIEARYDGMWAAGFEQELRALYERGDLNADLPAMRAVGYRQGWAWLDGLDDHETMREKALAATRQLAKRQLTWLRRECGTLWYDPDAGALFAGASGEAPEAGFRGVNHVIDRFLESSPVRYQMKHDAQQ